MFSWFFSRRTHSQTEMPLPPFLQTAKKEEDVALVDGIILRSFNVHFEIIIDPDEHSFTTHDLIEVTKHWSNEYGGPHLVEKMVKTLVVLAIHSISSEKDIKYLKSGLIINNRLTFAFKTEEMVPKKYLDYLYSDRISTNGKTTYMKIGCRFQEDDRESKKVWELYTQGKTTQQKIESFSKSLGLYGVKTACISQSMIYI